VAGKGYADALVERSPSGIVVVDSSGRVVFANPRAVHLLGFDGAEPVGQLAWAFVDNADLPDVRARHEQLLRSPTDLPGNADPVVASVTLCHTDGSPLRVVTTSAAAELDGARVVVLVITALPNGRAVGEAPAAGRALPDWRFTEAFHVTSTGMLLLDGHGGILDANDAAADLMGVAGPAAVGRSSLRLVHPEDRALVRTWLGALQDGTNATVGGERRILRPDGTTIWVHLSLARLPSRPAVYIAHLLDVSERRETEARLAHQALHDPLTGLPNRALLFDRLAQAVRAAFRGGPGVTVLYLDLDDFKAINDTHGHAVGDRVLMTVADRLVRVLRPADTVARLGGDEFAVVAEGLPEQAAQELAERVAETLSQPVALADGASELPVVASVGVAHSSFVPLDVDALMTAADADMYRAKQRNRAARPDSAF
jgi:diguanylate cyclase (GGDEF)-like protein/PAS domain S-box-containing protein